VERIRERQARGNERRGGGFEKRTTLGVKKKLKPAGGKKGRGGFFYPRIVGWGKGKN